MFKKTKKLRCVKGLSAYRTGRKSKRNSSIQFYI